MKAKRAPRKRQETAVTVLDAAAPKHAPVAVEPEPLPPAPPLPFEDIWERPQIIKTAPSWWLLLAVMVLVDLAVRCVWR